MRRGVVVSLSLALGCATPGLTLVERTDRDALVLRRAADGSETLLSCDARTGRCRPGLPEPAQDEPAAAPTLGAAGLLGDPVTGVCAGCARLSLLAYPWCRLEVDGRHVGTTPLRGLRLPAGSHEVRCVNPETAADERFGVRLRPGTHRRMVIGMRSPSRPSTVRPAVSPTPEPTPESVTGRLSMTSYPWCRIAIDGHDYGNTPLRGIPLAAGAHTVVCETEDGSRQELSVDVAAGAHRRLLIGVPGRAALASN